MRFRRGKGDADGVSAPAPDATTRVEDPAAAPPSEADRVDEPTGVQPTRESEVPAKVLPPSEGDAVAGDSPSDAEAAAADEGPVKIFSPPSSTDRVEAPAATSALSTAAPPSATARVDAPPPQAAQIVAAGPPARAATACPQCGSPAEPGQEMCIVCGARISRGPDAKRRGWLVPAVLAGLGVLLIGTATAFGIVELTKDDEVKKDDVADLNSQPTTTPPSQPPPAATTPPTDTAPTVPPASPDTTPQDTTPAPGTEPSPSPTPDTGNEIAEWPAGKTAYTVVLVSATSRNAADAKAEQAIKRGIKAGVLRSDDFSTLRAGYWVVFAGQYETSEQATRAADRYAEQGFGGGYPRQVKPK
jgi:hypothetical protein